MIQDIHPHQFNNDYVATTKVQDDSYVFYFKNEALLLKQDRESLDIPRKNDFTTCDTEGIYLFSLNQTPCFLIQHCPKASKPDAFTLHEIKFPHTIAQKEVDWASSVALQLKNWYEQNTYCGKCGSLTVHKKDERGLMCPSCGKTLYPTIAPAIIVAILCKNKILLAHGAHFREGFYSLIAGYTEIGETIEDTVRREVREEIGLQIYNIRYYKSQPWPFSGSMMIGFIADAQENQTIHIDGKEITDAAWYTRDTLPHHPPNRSIAGEIIEKFINNSL